MPTRQIAWIAWIAGLGALAIVVALFFLLRNDPPRSASAAPAPSVANTGPRSPPRSPDPPSKPPDPERTTALARNPEGFVIWPGAASASEMLNEPDQSAREDIGAVRTILADYHKVFGQVPEGGLNEEITRGLLGENPRRIVFLTPKDGTLGASGELLDRWGTPYFFHKLSRNLIDLRSAGPDQEFWTPDDVFDESTGGPPL